MTTVLDGNIHNLAVKGTFDDCQVRFAVNSGYGRLIINQDIVKALFNDPDTNQILKLGAVNSINWSRILAQIVYYFRSYFLLAEASSFSIGDYVKIVTSTGNFGNILAGYFAKKMGLPIAKLVGTLLDVSIHD